MPPVHSKRLPCRIIYSGGLSGQRRNSPCEYACPAGTAIQSAHFLLAEGRTDEALSFLLSRNPFPGITGRVCPHFCENACNRAEHDEAVAIRALERHVSGAGGDVPWPARAPSTGRRIAVIGSGPAGLSCACYAALMGHSVTVFESAPLMGGVPRHSLPEFRLPRQIADYETARVLKAGDITVHTNTALGRDIFLPALRRDFDACVLAVGLQKERRLPIPGGNLALPAVGWLKAANMERRSLRGEKVLIMGGGGVAFDCAFTALRLGASSVEMVCLEPADAMRVPVEELRQAEEEGIVIHNERSAARIVRIGNGGLRLEADRVAFFGFGEDGSLKLETVPGDSAAFEAGLLICASGLQPDLSVLGEGMPTASARGCIAADPETLETSLPGVFAAGDIASGPSSVAAAVGGGRAAALAAHRHVMGLLPGTCLEVSISDDNKVEMRETERLPPAHTVDYREMLHVDWHGHDSRRSSSGEDAVPPVLPFRELVPALSPADARAEAARCMHCGQCSACGNCVDHCPGHILEMGESGPHAAWPDQCWHCGCCRIACPDGAISYVFPLTMMV